MGSSARFLLCPSRSSNCKLRNVYLLPEEEKGGSGLSVLVFHSAQPNLEDSACRKEGKRGKKDENEAVAKGKKQMEFLVLGDLRRRRKGDEGMEKGRKTLPSSSSSSGGRAYYL